MDGKFLKCGVKNVNLFTYSLQIPAVYGISNVNTAGVTFSLGDISDFTWKFVKSIFFFREYRFALLTSNCCLDIFQSFPKMKAAFQFV